MNKRVKLAIPHNAKLGVNKVLLIIVHELYGSIRTEGQHGEKDSDS